MTIDKWDLRSDVSKHQLLTIIYRKSWGYRRNMAMEDVFSIEELLRELTVTVSCGGNLLMNVGPNKDGVIVPIFEVNIQIL